MPDLIILGAGGFARETAWLVERINDKKFTNQWNLLGFLDDDQELWGKSPDEGQVKVLGPVDTCRDYKDAWFVCAVGGARTRRNIIQRVKSLGVKNFAILLDPDAILSGRVRVGDGSIICAHTIITVDVTIGEHTILNLDCTVGHDAVLHDFVTLYPSVNVSGSTKLGECVEMGTGSQIIQGKKIGEDTIIGAGSVVVKDIPANCTAVGVPAVPIKYHS